jgi:hypoxanthine phosphoribosyltransferase
MIQIHDKSFKKFILQNDIENRIYELSKQLELDYSGKKPLFIGVLNGSFMFAAELFKNITLSAEITFVRVKSYSNTTSNGNTIEILGLTENIENRDIVIIEDIVDTGLTISEIILNFASKKPNSMAIATLLFKPKALQKHVIVDYVGFEIDPKFVIGYGLDYDGLGRNLGDIYVLNE